MGTLAYFLNKYVGRKDKTKAPSISFWIKDNWAQLLLAFIFDLAAMILVMDAGTTVDVTNWLNQLPIGIVVPGKLLLAFGCGFGLGWGAYNLLKKGQIRRRKESKYSPSLFNT